MPAYRIVIDMELGGDESYHKPFLHATLETVDIHSELFGIPVESQVKVLRLSGDPEVKDADITEEVQNAPI